MFTLMKFAVFATSVVSLCGQAVAQPQATSPQVYAMPQDKIFPQIVCGGGWETVIVLVNMGSATTPFTLAFFDESGSPMAVTSKTYPDLKLITSSGLIGQLPPGASFNFSLFNTGPLQVGWMRMAYDDSTGRISGNAVVRSLGSGGAQSEAVVPFSNSQDYKFFMPYDNIQGFVTAMAIVNPASNVATQVSFTFLDLNGKVILKDSLTLAPQAHLAFGLTDKYPVLRNTLGTLYVEGSTDRLSAMGLRFNPLGTFTSVPILNWSGMFQ